MKKLLKTLSLGLALVMLLALVGCSGANDLGYEDPLKGGNYLPNYSYDGDDAIAGADGSAADKEESEVPEAPDDGRAELYENPVILTENYNISTFSADVDTASYAFFRKLVNLGYSFEELKNSGTVFRTEEFVNYFKYNATLPADEELFGVYTEITDCPWNNEAKLLRLTLQAERAEPSAGNNLVFLIDVSGSMQGADKLDLLKKAFSVLVGNLGENDVVSIVTYAGDERVVLDGCKGSKDEMIMSAINDLESGGSTNGEAGLTKAYEIAEKHYINGGNNRIIMASDGDLNVGISSSEELERYVEEKRGQGVYLSVLGFGTGNYRDANMEAIADHGNGVYYYIDGESEAEKVLGTDLLSTLYTVAEDVKLQIEFYKDYIYSYRLIGYENRILDEEDFDDDTKDAGEVGASHQVTVCYEITLTDAAYYAANEEEAWMDLKVRYKNPGEPISLLDEYEIGKAQQRELGEDAEFISCVVETVMLLNESKYAGDATLGSILERLDDLDLSGYPDRAEFRELVRAIG